MFQVKEKVIYPGHGVAVIEDVVEKKVGEVSISFLKLVFLFKDMTILVPRYNVNTIGIRKPSEKRTIEKALHELHSKPERRLEGMDFTPSGWNRRNKEYQSKIQGGLLIEIAKIYRDLMHVSEQKELSFGERSLLQTTEELIVQELQVVKSTQRDQIIQEIRNPFKEFLFRNKDFGPGQKRVSSSAP